MRQANGNFAALSAVVSGSRQDVTLPLSDILQQPVNDSEDKGHE